MRLNPDCVRDILLELEKLDYNFYSTPEVLCSALPKYSSEDIQYTCLKLYEGNYIKASVEPVPELNLPVVFEIFDITFQGHEFLNTIRGKDVWDKLTYLGKSVGSLSLEVIKNAGSSLAVSLISHQIHK